MSEPPPLSDERDRPPAPVLLQRDPANTRRRRRIGLSLTAIPLIGFFVLFLLPPGALVGEIFLAPFIILWLVLAIAWWNQDPLIVRIDSDGVTKRSKHIPWSDVERVLLQIDQLHEGGYVVTFKVVGKPRRSSLWFQAHTIGLDIPEVAEAFALFAPPEVLDDNLRAYLDEPEQRTEVDSP